MNDSGYPAPKPLLSSTWMMSKDRQAAEIFSTKSTVCRWKKKKRSRRGREDTGRDREVVVVVCCWCCGDLDKEQCRWGSSSSSRSRNNHTCHAGQWNVEARAAAPNSTRHHHHVCSKFPWHWSKQNQQYSLSSSFKTPVSSELFNAVQSNMQILMRWLFPVRRCAMGVDACYLKSRSIKLLLHTLPFLLFFVYHNHPYHFVGQLSQTPVVACFFSVEE